MTSLIIRWARRLALLVSCLHGVATYAEQLRQMIQHLGGGPATVLGSSLGGSAAIEVAAAMPTWPNR